MKRKQFMKPGRAERPNYGFKLVQVRDESVSEDDMRNHAMEVVADGLSLGVTMCGWTFEKGLAACREFTDYFPGRNQIEVDGSWIMVTDPPQTEYTVPPMSFWFAVEWPMEGLAGNRLHRVKILTPRGELGLFPREYSKVDHIEKYYEFMGKGIEPIFFGAGAGGIPSDQMFYLRSRGIAKRDAIVMLMGLIKSQDVMYLLTDKSITDYFGLKWPNEDRLATVVPVEAEPEKKELVEA